MRYIPALLCKLLLTFGLASSSAAAPSTSPAKPADGPALKLTERAAKQVKAIAAEQEIRTYWLRIGLKRYDDGSGFGYMLDLTEDKPDLKADLEMTSHGIRIITARQHLDLLRGTEIDYVEEEGRSGFVFNNPRHPKKPGDKN